MSDLYEVDRFTTEQAWSEFAGRYRAVDKTVDALGLRGVNELESPALIFGGGALAKNRIDSYVPNKKAFDLDVIAPNSMFARLGRAGLIHNLARFHLSGFRGTIKPSSSVPLQVDIITSREPVELTTLVGHESYTGELNRSVVEMDGVHVLRPSVVAMQKVMYQRSRIRDLAGVVKAHVVAAHKEHPILQDPKWQEAVSLAVNRLTTGEVETATWRTITKRGPGYPSWMRQLIQADFDHPAFVNIPR